LKNVIASVILRSELLLSEREIAASFHYIPDMVLNCIVAWLWWVLVIEAMIPSYWNIVLNVVA
jgi:hypothetical protein